MPAHPTTWILVADRAQARILDVGPDGGLREVACFADPEGRAAGRDLESDRPPRVHESVGGTRHAIEPHTSLHDKTATRFARLLRDALVRGHDKHSFDRLVLVAPPRFLGFLRDALDKALLDCVIGEVGHDLTGLATHDLRGHLPDEAFA
ncbi:host attachment protein [Dokdonella immobilis]|uniref:Protein required for attachment to host cells n=1 Tax=Dokdonella immobilis TaxID=578942 RepID=A0A1I4ZBE7_9GAMM|nr:host attachment protein [Dokdonella immobilis]SFN47299.1 Protein required for attachment to host cells [Dokdonella immobilis]